MQTAVVNTVAYVPFTLLDASGNPVTGKADGDFAKTAYLASIPATTAIPIVTEASGGRYVLSVTPTALGTWHAAWSIVVGGDTLRFEEVLEVQTAAQADILGAAVGGAAGTVGGALARLEVAPLTIAAPVRPSNDAEVTQGDDYLVADGRALQWTASGWPVLTGATAALTVWDRTGAVALTKAGTVTPATPLVSVDLTRVETAALPVGGNRYAVVATLADATVATLATGVLTVTPSPP